MKKYFKFSILLVLLLISCSTFSQISVEDAAKTAVAQTQAVEDAVARAIAQTEAAQVVAPPVVILNPTQTEIKIPPTETPNPIVNATITTSANCRSGPDGKFELVTTLTKGTTALVIGQNSVNLPWWLLKVNDKQECWVVGDNLTILGSTAAVPEVESPPVPTSFYSAWVGTWTAWQNQCLNNSSDCENTFSITWDMTDAKTIIGSYSTEGCSYTDILTLSSDQMRADGVEISDCGNFEVHLVMDPNLSQFRGRWNVGGNTSIDGYYCGARNGYGKPNPTRP